MSAGDPLPPPVPPGAGLGTKGQASAASPGGPGAAPPREGSEGALTRAGVDARFGEAAPSGAPSPGGVDHDSGRMPGGGASADGSLIRRALRRARRIAGFGALAVLAYVAVLRVLPPLPGPYMIWEFARLGGLARDWTPIERISPALVLSVIAAEDARFCRHWGIDLAAIEDARAAAAAGRTLRGASTITQQTAKNVFLWQGRSWVRKGLEAGFALTIEALWGKRRIIEVYLNVAEMGEGVFGAEAAARHWFGVGAADLSATQAARLAAILPNPKERSPARPSGFVARRAAQIARGAGDLAQTGAGACALPRPPAGG